MKYFCYYRNPGDTEPILVYEPERGRFDPDILPKYFAERHFPCDFRRCRLYDKDKKYIKDLKDTTNKKITDFLFNTALPHFRSLDLVATPKEETVFHDYGKFRLNAILQPEDVSFLPDGFNLAVPMEEASETPIPFYIAESLHIFKIVLEFWFDVVQPDGTLSPYKYYVVPIL